MVDQSLSLSNAGLKPLACATNCKIPLHTIAHNLTKFLIVAHADGGSVIVHSGSYVGNCRNKK